MVGIIWTAFAWGLVFLLMPFKRIKQLWQAAVISFIWTLIIDSIFISLGYYSFPRPLVSILETPLFYLVGCSAGGMLLLNFLPRKYVYRALYVAGASILFLIAERFFTHFGAFQRIKWDWLLGFTQNMAGMSILVWVCLGVVGEDVIFEGRGKSLNNL